MASQATCRTTASARQCAAVILVLHGKLLLAAGRAAHTPTLFATMPQSSKSVASDAGCNMTPAPYSMYWNIGGPGFWNMSVTQWGFVAGNDTQTGDDCSQTRPPPYGNCSSWTAGLWPSITDDGVPVNGGVPQAASLSAHLEYIQTHIDSWLPDPNWSGNAVFDFEYWTPIWEQNTNPTGWHGERYQNYSRALVAAAHPDWNSSQIEAEAKSEFEAAAMQFFVSTLQLCTSLRPKAQWGYYGFPYNVYGPCVGFGPNPQCGYRNPLVGPILQALNDELAPVWAASTGIYPSIYMPEGTNSSFFAYMNSDYVSGTTEEAARLVAAYSTRNPPPPIRPFAWAFYHDGVAPLLPSDLQSELLNPLDAGADGVVLWGDPPAFNHVDLFLEYLNSTLGPMVLNITSTQCTCAQQRCSSHGACVGNATEPSCRCFPGYSGDSCGSGSGVP